MNGKRLPWPVLRQLQGPDKLALGSAAKSDKKEAWHARTADAKVVKSVCPFCAVGCGQNVYVKDGKVTQIEGDPGSPISRGRLCPKGAASYQLAVNERRWTTVKYRAPNSEQWEDRPLDWAMDRIAQLLKQTRDNTFQEKTPDGTKTLMSTTAIFSLGGATIDNEWNYAHSKLMRGLGIVAVENQARI